MNNLPYEILTSIAAQLPATADICQFRLLERRCAAAAFPVLFEHVHILNTLECLHDTKAILKSPHGSLASTRHLTLYHGTWPSNLSLSEWRNHPLALRRENSNDQAFEIYRRFNHTEASRQFDNDVAQLNGLLDHFTLLRSLRIADVHAYKQGASRNLHYNALKNRLNLLPCFQGNIHDVLAKASYKFNLMQHLTMLSVDGNVDASAIIFRESFPRILSLSITGLLVKSELGEAICRFLSSFPNIRHLSLQPTSFGRLSDRILPLPAMYLTNLCYVELYGIGTSEHELLDFVCRHSLRSLSLTGITLTEGTWESFFTKLRRQVPGIQFHGNGMLAAVHSQTYWLDVFSLRLLRLFLTAGTFPWPFATLAIW